ncbi:MAG: lipopolysaccharide transport periplasmic protein LptA [Woeseiaceae bacterium]
MLYKKNKLLTLLFTLFLTVYTSPSFATQNKDVIDIKSQRLLFDEAKGISQYKGHVVMKKGTLTIKASSITVYYKNKKLSKAIIIGSPANIEQHPDNEKSAYAQANRMEYYVDEERLILKGDASVQQGERFFSGEEVEYDTRQRIILASGKNEGSLENKNESSSNGRVHVIIGPAKETE